jgi:hypothetical protein
LLVGNSRGFPQVIHSLSTGYPQGYPQVICEI